MFWSDVNGAVFVLAGMPAATERSIVVEDCDVIYPRHCSTTWNGGRVFSKRAEQAPKQNGVTKVDVTFRNNGISDPFQTLETFHLKSKDGSKSSGGFSGIVFQNITSVKTPLSGENKIVGHSGGPWDNITFDNVVLGEKRFKSEADLGEIGDNVTNLKFVNKSTSIKKDKYSGGYGEKTRIYPNPASGKLCINPTNSPIHKIQMMDLTGKVVFADNDAGKTETIDLTGFISGTYVVRIFTDVDVFTSKVTIN